MHLDLSISFLGFVAQENYNRLLGSLEQSAKPSLNNLTVIEYNGQRSNQSVLLSPGYQYFPLTMEVKEKVQLVIKESYSNHLP